MPETKIVTPEQRASFIRKATLYFHFLEDLRNLTDEQVGELLMENVWGQMEACSDECAIVEAAIERLGRSKKGAMPPTVD